MKKVMFCAALALAAVGGIVANKVTNQPSKPLNDLALANIAALTSDEESLSMACSTTLIYTDSWNTVTMDCTSCSYITGYIGWNDSRCTD